MGAVVVHHRIGGSTTDHAFELRDVDRVAVLGAGGEAGDLAELAGSGVADGNRPQGAGGGANRGGLRLAGTTGNKSGHPGRCPGHRTRTQRNAVLGQRLRRGPESQRILLAGHGVIADRHRVHGNRLGAGSSARGVGADVADGQGVGAIDLVVQADAAPIHVQLAAQRQRVGAIALGTGSVEEHPAGLGGLVGGFAIAVVAVVLPTLVAAYAGVVDKHAA